MPQKRKFQVFISSTFSDLKEERQAAVEAVLTAGHIPAGMELFTAGDESQMEVIKRWIDESDIYLLILGGRYGSVETTTGKSYTQLEYEYAVSKGKPYFAIAIEDKANDKRYKRGKAFVEIDNPALLKEFRSLVTSKIVRFWEDKRDIKIAIHEKLSEFNLREDLVGWVLGNESVNTGLLAEEIVRLTRENNNLREELKLNSKSQVLYNTLSYEEMIQFLKSRKLKIDEYIFLKEEAVGALKDIATVYNDEFVSLFHIFIIVREMLLTGVRISIENQFSNLVAHPLIESGLIKIIQTSSSLRISLSEIGKQFLMKLRLNGILDKIDSKFDEYHKIYNSVLPIDIINEKH